MDALAVGCMVGAVTLLLVFVLVLLYLACKITAQYPEESIETVVMSTTQPTPLERS